MSTLTVGVTAEHIEQGIPTDPDHCPVALALEELNLCVLFVQPDEVHFVHRGTHHVSDLPLAAAEFIRNYDANIPVQPFSFELVVPPAADS